MYTRVATNTIAMFEWNLLRIYEWQFSPDQNVFFILHKQKAKSPWSQFIKIRYFWVIPRVFVTTLMFTINIHKWNDYCHNSWHLPMSWELQFHLVRGWPDTCYLRSGHGDNPKEEFQLDFCSIKPVIRGQNGISWNRKFDQKPN